jgi:hypothetical protein
VTEPIDRRGCLPAEDPPFPRHILDHMAGAERMQQMGISDLGAAWQAWSLFRELISWRMGVPVYLLRDNAAADEPVIVAVAPAEQPT